MSVIDALDAGKYQCPFREWRPCVGDACMAWSWSGPAFDYAETDNLQETAEGTRPIGVPPPPADGEGWETEGPAYNRGYHRSGKDKLPPATGQRWVRRRLQQRGFCGRVGAGDNTYPF